MTETSPVSTPAPKPGFAFVVESTFKFFWQTKWLLAKAFLITAIFEILVVAVLVGIAFASHTVLMAPLLLVLGWLGFVIFGMLYYGAAQRQVYLTISNGPEEAVWDSYKNALGLFWRAIYLGLKVIVYSGIWAIFVVLLAYAVLATVIGAGVDFPNRGMILTIGNFALGILGLASIIFVIIRSVWASLAFPLLFATPGITAKEALDSSIAFTKGKWWIVVLYSVGFSLLVSIAVQAIGMLSMALGHSPLAIVAQIVEIIAIIVAGMLQITLKQTLTQELKNRGSEYHF